MNYRRQAAWNRPLWLVLSVLALVIVLFWPTSREIVELWQDTVRRRYTHGWLVLAITLWLIWRDRVQLGVIALTPPTAGWILVAVGSVGWVVGLNAGLLVVTTLAVPLLALSAVWAAGGWGLVRRVAFAVLYLYFALPVWEIINPLLQSLTVFVVLWFTRLSGIPVEMDGQVIHIPAGSFEIAGGCSGLHFLVVALAIAALQGQLDRNDLRSRFLLSGIAAALALLTNWVRVFVIIVAGHLTDMQHFLVKVDHYYFGWFIFLFALGSYLYLSRRVPHGIRDQLSTVPASTTIPIGRNAGAIGLSFAALALGPVWALAASDNVVERVAQSPPVLDGWAGPGLSLSDWRPVFANADEEFLVSYQSKSGGGVTLYHAVYRSQRQGKELRGYGNTVLGANYHLQEVGPRNIYAGPREIPALEHLAIGVDGRQLLVWSVFAVDGTPDALGLASQLVYGARALLRFPSASVVALAAECRPDCESARNALEAAAVRVLPKLLSTDGARRTETLTAGAG